MRMYGEGRIMSMVHILIGTGGDDMKKRCTNNKCRKNFVVKENSSYCLYCNRKYPRLQGSLLTKGDCNKDISANFWNKEIKSLRRLLTGMPYMGA